jgi:type IV pilus assembly protein PilN
MARINLRPWREELRAEKQRQFVSILVGCVVFAVAIVFAWQAEVSSEVEYQNSRNAYIQHATRGLDKKIAEIKTLRKKKEELLARMKVIQDLQGKRPVIVREFDEMVKTLPNGLYYTKLTQKGDVITIQGRAESNNRISNLMRNFEKSPWFTNPNLTAVRASGKPGDLPNEFNMTVLQQTPDEGVDN